MCPFYQEAPSEAGRYPEDTDKDKRETTEATTDQEEGLTKKIPRIGKYVAKTDLLNWVQFME